MVRALRLMALLALDERGNRHLVRRPPLVAARLEVFRFGTAIAAAEYSDSCRWPRVLKPVPDCERAAQRGSPSSPSCSCGSRLRSLPQTGQRPAQSSRQRILFGSASTTASWAQAERSSSALVAYGVVSSSDSPGLVAWYSRLLDVDVEAGVGEAAHARAEHPDLQLELEDEARARLGQRQHRLRALRDRHVALAPERERLEDHVDRIERLLPGRSLTFGR